MKIVKKVKYVIPVDYFWLISKGIKGRIKLMPRDAMQKLSKRLFIIQIEITLYNLRNRKSYYIRAKRIWCLEGIHTYTPYLHIQWNLQIVKDEYIVKSLLIVKESIWWHRSFYNINHRLNSKKGVKYASLSLVNWLFTFLWCHALFLPVFQKYCFYF